MGNLLFIRVSAETYDEQDVPKTWPFLFRFVFPETSDVVLKKIGEASPYGQKNAKRGVLELVQGLLDAYKFSDDFPQKESFQIVMARLEEDQTKLERALGNRDAGEAYQLTNSIEEALSDAESLLREASV